MGIIATHLDNFPCLKPMYVAANCIPATPITSPVSGVIHVPSGFHSVCFPMICYRNPVCIPANNLSIAANMTHEYNPNSSTTWTTDL